MRRVLLLAALAVVLSVAVDARAHGTRSVTVEVTETSPGQATLHVRALTPEDRVAAELEPPCSSRAHGAALRVECPGGLAGATLRVRGLGPIVTEAIVAYRFADGRTGSSVVRGGDPTLRFPEAAGALSVARGYVGLGVAHILGGYDHLLFLLLLVLSLRRVRAVLLAETAFTLSHSLSFAATATGALHVSTAAAEACIALSLVLMALEIRAEPRPAARGALLAFAFGLVHGLGFAGGLAEIGLPDGDAAAALVGFGAGVELGQLLFLAAALLAVRVASRFVTAGRRLARAEAIAIAAIGGVSTYWFAERALACFTTSA